MNSPIEYPETFRLARWLRHPEHWSRVIGPLKDRRDKAAVDGLIELIHRPPSAKAAQAAIEASESFGESSIIDALGHALKSPHVSVRLAALRSLRNRQEFSVAPVVSRMLDWDTSWLIRRAALEFLSQSKNESRWLILKAGNDPHWRVRQALIQVLLEWIETGQDRNEITDRLLARGNDLRIQGLLRYLDFRISGQPPEPLRDHEEDPAGWCEFWDWDPAVLAYRLEKMPAKKRREALAIMPRLVGHEDERVRRLAALPLWQNGDVKELLETLVWLDDPRHEAFQTVIELMPKLDWQRIESVVQSVWDLERPTPGQWFWALGQTEITVSVEDIPRFHEICLRAMRENSFVRAKLARTLCRTSIPEREDLLKTLLEDPDPDVVVETLKAIARKAEAEMNPIVRDVDWRRFLEFDDPEIRAVAATIVLSQKSAGDYLPHLASDPSAEVRMLAARWLVKQKDDSDSHWLKQLQDDESFLVRAAALTKSRAKELLEHPASETSWLVLEHAARLAKTPLWKIAPKDPPMQEKAEGGNVALLSLRKPAALRLRSLDDWQVSPLGISGHYGLPVEGFVRAIEAGVNLMFWEPNYQTLTNFMGRLSAQDRNGIRMVAGTFEADPSRIRKDVERALAKLQIEQITVFLLFWTRSWDRITDAVREMLEELKHSGKIGLYGLSTHSRPLALEAINFGWNPVMVRHSAAHLGAEGEIFPAALEQGTNLFTFNNTCYGRLLEAFREIGDLSPADCYRYTLSFDAVTASWSAPATCEELEANLEALRSPELPPHRLELLLGVGRRVYQEDTIFRQLVRGV